MEGIADGRARDDCFYCALVYPERYSDDCPRCGRRMRYQPAILMTPAALVSALTAHLGEYHSATTNAARRERLEALLRWLHRHLPAAQAALDELASRGHPNLAQLRSAYQHLPDSESPKHASEI